MEKLNAQKLHDTYTDKVISYMEQDGYKLLSRAKLKDGSVHDFVVEKHGETFQIKTLFLSGKTDIIVTLRSQVLLNRIKNRVDQSGHFVLVTNGRLYKPWKEKYEKEGIIVMDSGIRYPWNEN